MVGVCFLQEAFFTLGKCTPGNLVSPPYVEL